MKFAAVVLLEWKTAAVFHIKEQSNSSIL